jgi:hypothetical protein
VQSKGINIFKDVLLPLVKAGSHLGSPALAELLSRMVIELPLGVFSHDPYVIDPCDRGIMYRGPTRTSTSTTGFSRRGVGATWSAPSSNWAIASAGSEASCCRCPR